MYYLIRQMNNCGVRSQLRQVICLVGFLQFLDAEAGIDSPILMFKWLCPIGSDLSVGSMCVEERVSHRVVAHATSIGTKTGHVVWTGADKVVNVLDVVQTVRSDYVSTIGDKSAKASVHLAPSIDVVPESALITYRIHGDYTPIVAFVELNDRNRVSDDKRIRSRDIAISARFAIESINDISSQENDSALIEQRESFELIARARELAVRVDRVLDELDAEWLNEPSDVGDGPDVVVDTPHHQLLPREDRLHELQQLRIAISPHVVHDSQTHAAPQLCTPYHFLAWRR